MIKGTVREMIAEFLGTFTLLVFGIGSVAQAVLSGRGADSLLSINLAWGLAVTMGIYVAGGVSGAHLNPAVTIALAVFHQFPWRKVAPFIVAQFAGAIFASFIVYAVYFEALEHFDGGIRMISGDLGTAGIWATYPQSFLSVFPGGLVDQTIGTALLVLLVFALSDRKNLGASTQALSPLLVGAAVVLIGMTFGFNAGYAINPARDLGPRLFTALGGWGWEVFTAFNYWWWVPVVGPMVGGLLGGLAYQGLIAWNHPEEIPKSVESSLSESP